MSEVTIRWTQRAAGRDIGEVETVERTAFIDAVIAAGRVDVLEEAADAPVEVEKPGPRPTARVRVVPDGATDSE